MTEVRAAAARIRAIIRSGQAHLDTDGLHLWREPLAGIWKADIDQVSQALTTLEVPHTITTAPRPFYRSASAPAVGHQADIAWDHLRLLLPRMPKTLTVLIDGVLSDIDDPGRAAALRAALTPERNTP